MTARSSRRPRMLTPRFLCTAAAVMTALALSIATGVVQAQDSQSATDAGGQPIESTDGLIRSGDADEMWRKLSSADDMPDLAAERWPEIEASRFGELETKNDLVALVSESYSIDEQAAMREVDSWVMETADDL